ncbi:hypothetical protein VTK73DRAFT_8728 [Phialemonium thermophilum]|uniref:TUG ubiquitin-like domain-containing protein n=1 Tax=Phialemonium thermophilum TaxID=223376 RepID=A0ABR3XNL7_9PEZI
MSTHVEVITADLRRAKVKVTPGTYLVDVLQEACKKLNLPSDKYSLKYKQKQLDLSGPFRTSGLIPGAKLELVAKSSSPSVISVALQLSGPDAAAVPNGRLTGKIPSDFTLWKVLRQFESGEASGGHNINLTARGIAQTIDGTASGTGQLYYEMPVLNIMGREVSSLEDLQKTLSQCGINSGSVLIRVSFRTTTKPLHEAMQDISQYLGEVEPRPAPKETESSSKNVVGPTPSEGTEQGQAAPEKELDAEKGQPQISEKEIESPRQPEEGHRIEGEPPRADSLQPVGVFLAPSGNTPAAALIEEADSDFLPTVAHAQLHQARLLASSQNQRLKSDAELAAEAEAEAARLAAVKSIQVRVRFPDGTSAQWQFGPETTGGTLYRAVRGVMAHDGQAFKLVLPGGGGAIRDADGPGDTLVRGHGLRGGVVVNLVWDNAASAAARSQPFLKASVARTAREVVVPKVPDAEPDDDNDGAPGSKGSATAISDRKEKSNGLADGAGKKLPKWLKLPGKK